MKKIRLRLAPSPTGFLHIGNLRTFLFVHFAAKKLNGKMLLRIEDTDKSREVEGATEKLIDILDWIGIDFDEGPHKGGDYGPYIQSQRLEIYKKYSDQLLTEKKAYRCFCSSERLEEMRAAQQAQKLPPRYDRACLNLTEEEIKVKMDNNEPFVIRQKMPTKGDVIVNDLLRGEIKFGAAELEDHVLIKTNGIPTYQFANVVDDHLMEISHVFRGDEWISSFPKNILLYKDFGWEPPIFIHTPLILNKVGGGKLSKRQGDVAVEEYRNKGYLPVALINFCMLMGWHPKGDNEILNSEEIIKEFDIKDISISPAVFDLDKLDYLNGYYIRQMNLDELTKMCTPYLQENIKKASNPHKKEIDFIKKAVSLEQERLKKLSEIGEFTEFLFLDDINLDKSLLAWKKMSVTDAQSNLKLIIELLEKIPDDNWTDNSLEEGIINYLQTKELKIGEYLWPMRVALSGKKASPSPFEIAEVLGRDETVRRIKKAIEQ